jgi:N-acetylneuraminic acid mutarotase
VHSTMQRRLTWIRFFASGLALAGSWVLSTATISARDLSFDERVKAQQAIDKVYYSHLIGARKTFEQAVPRSILEDKVHLYLKQSEALERLWSTPVTEEMLSQELGRMARQTRMPERLQELYTALGNDLFTIEECLARPALVSRMSRNFFAFDKTIHSDSRTRAVDIRDRLKAGHLDPWAAHPNRSEIAVSRLADGGGADTSSSAPAVGPDPSLLPLPADEFDQFASLAPEAPGEIGPLIEEGDHFVVRVLLEREPAAMRVAAYVVRKTSWDEWWTEEAKHLDGDKVRAASSGRGTLPAPGGTRAPSGSPGGDSITSDSSLPSATVESGAFSSQQLSLDAVPVNDTWSNGSLYNVPDPRHSHTAVWTGSEMIVWGGFNGGAYLNTGGRYNPATDSWTPTSVVGAPVGRALHTAVWTGSTMIVWGGYSPTIIKACPLNCICATLINLPFNPNGTGGVYDPVSDTWTPTTLQNTNGDPAPSPRYGHAAIWANNQQQMIVWGGFGVSRFDRFNRPQLDYLDTGGVYDPAGDTWTATPFHLYFTSVCDNSPKTICSTNDQCSGGTCLPTDNSNLNPGDMPTARWLHSMVLIKDLPTVFDDFGNLISLSDAKITIWGGFGATAYKDSKEPSCIDPTKDIHFRAALSNDYLPTGFGYNITDPLLGPNTWLSPTSTTNAPEPRQYQTTVWTGSKMIIWGGYRNGNSLNSGGQYDPVNDSWSLTTTAMAPAVRYFHSAVWTGDPIDRMLIWGGFDGSTQTNLNSGGAYDPVGNSWTPLSTVNAPDSRFKHSATWTGDKMIIWGGLGDSGDVATGGRYDVGTDSWTPTAKATTPAARSELAAVWSGSQMVTFGGVDKTTNTYFGAGDLYDPVTDTWTPVAATGAPQARSAPTGILAGGPIVFWGGYIPGIDATSGLPIKVGVSTGGRYDPATNSWIGPTSTTGAPAARIRHTAVWTGSDMIVWGGAVPAFNVPLGQIQETPVNTGGRYKPSTDTWTATATTGAPAARQQHAAVWTGSQMIIWGGFSGATFLNTGGRYDPATDSWGSTSLTGAPTIRLEPGAVWTGSPTNRMVIWGGQGDVLNNQGDPVLTNLDTGGQYDPVADSWTPTSTTNAPEGRFGPSSLWTGTQMLVWGGTKGPFGIYPNTGGRYDPALDQWTPTTLLNVPSPRYKHGAVWTGSQMIVWGGFDGAPLGSGGIYSALAGILATFFRDADADGCGDPGTAVQSYSQPSGYVTNSLDCNDTNSTVWSIPSEVPDLELIASNALAWSPPSNPGSTNLGYDAIRSSVAGDFVDGAVCVATNTAGQSAIDDAAPSPGQVFFYLVRADDGCPGGEGPLGTDSSGVTRVGRSCP